MVWERVLKILVKGSCLGVVGWSLPAHRDAGCPYMDDVMQRRVTRRQRRVLFKNANGQTGKICRAATDPGSFPPSWCRTL